MLPVIGVLLHESLEVKLFILVASRDRLGLLVS